MARITPTQADSIILYLYTQGYKAGGARPLGPDIIEYLIGAGHTFSHRAETKIRDMKSGGWTPLLKKWATNAPIVPVLFGGLTAYEVDSLYTKHLLTGTDIELGTDPLGSPTGGKGRHAKYAHYNQTGWDNINLQSIAMTGKPDPTYLALLKELQGPGPPKPFRDLFDTVYTRYKVGTALGEYVVSPPTVGGATPITPSTPAEEEEEEDEEEPEPLPSIIGDLADKLSLEDVTLFLGDGDDAPEPWGGTDRKISSKAYNLAEAGAFEVTEGKIVIRMKKLKAEQVVDWMWPALASIGKSLPEWEDMLSKGEGGVVEVLDEDGEPYNTLEPPEVIFIVDTEEKTVSIGINGKVVPATTTGGSPYTFDKAEIIVEDPAIGDKIQEVLLDGTTISFGKQEGVKFEYGLPIDGVQGLPEECYEDHYPEGEGKAGEDATTLSNQSKGRFFEEGGRAVWFGKVKAIEYNIENLGEKTLQPLALDFDTTLDLETEGVYFVLVYENPLDGSDLFPGFDINSSVDANQEAIFFPNDVRNLRPINEDGLVMLQKLKARRAGEGIESIETASSDLIFEVATLELGDKVYAGQGYSQVQITFEDGEQLLIPDGDERFKALDNSDTEIKGVVSVNETSEKPYMLVVQGKQDHDYMGKHGTVERNAGTGQEVYESLEKGRRAARLSNRFNRKDKDQKINTQTAMIQQGDSYYIIMGVGKQTVLVEMDMSRED